MELGTRSIRSSGRGSGSIEITLPSRLRAFSGLACRVTWHDAPVPYVTLVPDLRAARLSLDRMWALLLTALALPPGPPANFEIGLVGGGWNGLHWNDALALSQAGAHEAAVVSRVLATLVGLAHPASAGFAAALAYLATGAAPGADHRDDCIIAAAALPARAAAPLDGFSDALWQNVAHLAAPLMALHQALAADPTRHQALKEAARVGAALDLRGLLP